MYGPDKETVKNCVTSLIHDGNNKKSCLMASSKGPINSEGRILMFLQLALFLLTGGLGLDMNMVQEASASEDSEQVQPKQEQHEQIK